MIQFEYTAAIDLIPDWKKSQMNKPQADLTGFKEFDDTLGGLRPNELTLFCAPTGAGKTQWLASLAKNLLIKKVPTYIASVETGDLDFLTRVISGLEGLDLNAMTDNLSKSAADKIVLKHAKTLEGPMFLAKYDNRVEVIEMINYLKHVHKEHGVRVALLDNLNFFLRVSSSTMEKAEMDSAIHEFVMLAKAIPMHIILVCHPKKTDHGKVVSEFDIKGSSTAVQEAANVLLFNRVEASSNGYLGASAPDVSGIREAVFRKVRKRGMVVGKKIYFRYDNANYYEISKPSYVE